MLPANTNKRCGRRSGASLFCVRAVHSFHIHLWRSFLPLVLLMIKPFEAGTSFNRDRISDYVPLLSLSKRDRNPGHPSRLQDPTAVRHGLTQLQPDTMATRAQRKAIDVAISPLAPLQNDPFHLAGSSPPPTTHALIHPWGPLSPHPKRYILSCRVTRRVHKVKPEFPNEMEWNERREEGRGEHPDLPRPRNGRMADDGSGPFLMASYRTYLESDEPFEDKKEARVRIVISLYSRERKGAYECLLSLALRFCFGSCWCWDCSLWKVWSI